MKINKSYLDHNFSHRPSSAKIEWLVVHYTGIASAQGRAALVARALQRASQRRAEGGLGRAASTHYLVGEDAIIQLVRDRHAAWHCGGYKASNKCLASNGNSIGIDLVERKLNVHSGSVHDRDWYFSEPVLSAGAKLLAKLADTYGIPDERIIRHFDITGKLCPRPFVGRDRNDATGELHEAAWLAFKARIRALRGEA